MSHLSTHVLDTTHGRPASGVVVTLRDPTGARTWSAATDDDGRAPDLGPERLSPGEWTLTFHTGDYWAGAGATAFHPRVDVVFTVPESADAHYHVPLLLTPFAYSTYRGS